MSWQHTIVVAFTVLGSIGAVLNIGKPREPLTQGTVVAMLTLNGLIVFLILTG